jgi:hypothetical protein
MVCLRNISVDILYRGDTDDHDNNNNNNNNNNTAAYEQLARIEYLKRRDGLAKIMHKKLAEAAELIKKNPVL